MHHKSSPAVRWLTIATPALIAVMTLSATASAHPRLPGPVRAETVTVSPAPTTVPILPDSLFGRSGKLRFKLFSASGFFALPILERLFGDPAAESGPGVYHAAEDIMGRPFAFISMIPFTEKAGGKLGDYRVGFWPNERHRRTAQEAYENPEGFIEVTPENQDTYVSEHFRLRDFLTHDQQDVWPKYLVLRESLVDKLELVIEDLAAHGVRVEHLVVMSGFRTPQYNSQGVERAHPELAGGAAPYRATRAHGPFAHVDTRGARARWGRS